MKINEVNEPTIDTGKLLQLASFFLRRAEDTGAKPEISKDMFIKMATNYGIMINKDQLVDLANQPPLNTVFDPVEPTSDVIRFKGSEPSDVKLPGPDQSQQIVAKAAKSAMKRGLNK